MKRDILLTKCAISKFFLAIRLLVLGFLYLAVWPLHLLLMMVNIGYGFRDSFKPSLLTFITTSILVKFANFAPNLPVLPKVNNLFLSLSTGISSLTNFLESTGIGLLEVPVFGLKIFGEIYNLLLSGAMSCNVYGLIVLVVFVVNAVLPMDGTPFAAILGIYDEYFSWIPEKFQRLEDKYWARILGK